MLLELASEVGRFVVDRPASPVMLLDMKNVQHRCCPQVFHLVLSKKVVLVAGGINTGCSMGHGYFGILFCSHRPSQL